MTPTTFIYIPICFYYFLNAIFLIVVFNSFTFQYVSIISESWTLTERSRTDLHSNMFLLFQRCICSTAQPERDLHSNMFLLFLFVNFLFFARLAPFTFQYVSIISDCVHAVVILFHIYIPICFYYF